MADQLAYLVATGMPKVEKSPGINEWVLYAPTQPRKQLVTVFDGGRGQKVQEEKFVRAWVPVSRHRTKQAAMNAYQRFIKGEGRGYLHSSRLTRRRM